mmetsp:Transcript_28329/g.52841  ORF Transcript_28329/g.52841 Transcript_28329/m.52841 type:complete len:287 (-) Transcript_28329:529-1389(-)
MRSAAIATVSWAASMRASDRARASRASEAERSASRSARVATRRVASASDKTFAASVLRACAVLISSPKASRLAASSPGKACAETNSASEVALRSDNSAVRFSAVSSRCFQPLISLVISCARLVRASPVRRRSSWAERRDIMVMRAASTVMRKSSTSARAASRFGRSASALSASATRVRAPIASSSWRVTARPSDSSRPCARLRSASARLSARAASATKRSASRRANRACLSALVRSVRRAVSASWACRAPSARAVARSSDCFNSSKRLSCCSRSAAALGASSAQAR